MNNLIRSEKALIKPLLSSSMQSLDLFAYFLKSKSSKLSISAADYQTLSNLSDRQIRYKGDIIISVISNNNKEVQFELMKYWINTLLADPVVEAVFKKHGWIIPEEYLSLDYKVYKASLSLQK